VRRPLIAVAAGLLFAAAWASADAQSTPRLFVPIAVRNASISEVAGSPTPTPSITPTPQATATPTPLPARLVVESHSGRSTSSYHYIYVKLVNEGQSTAYRPVIRATYYDAQGGIAGSEQRSTTLRMLQPGEFSVDYTIGQPSATWVRYELSASSESSTSFIYYVHDGLEVSNLNTYRTGSTVYVVGQLRNTHDFTVRSPLVNVGIYVGGTIVEANYAYPFSPGDAAPGATASFSVSFFDPDNRLAGYEYSVRAEGYFLR
jgi:hypothetical protein